MRNIFRERLHENSGGETSPKPFPKKSISTISLNQQSEIMYSLFLFCVQVKDYQNISKKVIERYLFSKMKHFQKLHRGLELISLSCFLHCFWRKVFLTFCSINRQNLTASLPWDYHHYFLREWTICILQ